MDRDELRGWLRLTLTPGVGNQGARRLLAAFGLPADIFGQTALALQQVVGSDQATSLQVAPEGLEVLLDATLAWLQADHGKAPTSAKAVVSLGDARYPAALLALADPPLMLYYQGVAELVADPLQTQHALESDFARCIAIVGSRNPTAQGLGNAQQFAKSFGQAGLTVVSGMALGIDGAAHEGALETAGGGNGRVVTIAVVGTGLDRVYPKQHLPLARRIAQQGLLISEYPIGTPPIAANFPKRNRLIAALSQGTLVVEAALQSGSLITAREAAEQGKEVFAIPGSIHAPQSHGCHALIKQGAKLVESAQDVLEELRWPVQVVSATAPSNTAASSAAVEEDALLQALGFDPVGLDALQARTGIDTPRLQAQLMALELAGDVARLPGGLFQRLAQA